MKYRIAALLILFIASCNKNKLETEDTTNFEKLDWMLGIWEGTQGDADIYESWTRQNYRTMNGVSFTTQDEVRIYSQMMHLEQSNNKIFFIITPKETNEETSLNLINVSDSDAVFINQDSTGYPKKIVYKKISPKKMEVDIEGETQESSTSLNYRKTKDY